MIRRTFLFVLLALGITASAAALAQQPAGTAVVVVRWAYGTPPNKPREDLQEQDVVVTNERLQTVPYGALHVRLADNTDLRLGSDTDVVLDKYFYNPNSGSGTLAANMTKGAFRFVTGAMQIGEGGFQVETPEALIGVRGTDASVFAGAFGTIVAVVEGIVEIVAKATGATATAGPGDVVGIAADGSLRSGVEAPSDDGLGNEAATAPESHGGEGQGQGLSSGNSGGP